jgi:ElaB/YqjD/DUF883 family membrane-anchored ribosome-binding protein
VIAPLESRRTSQISRDTDVVVEHQRHGEAIEREIDRPVNRANRWLQEHPIIPIVAAVGCGLLLGWIVKRKGH